jgi:Zn-dependent protease with chaperone function
MLINNIFVVLFLVGTAFSLILNQTLNFSAFRARKKHGTRVPTELFGYTDTKTLSKTCEYRNAHYFLGIPADVLSTVVGVALLCGGFYAFLYNRLSSALGNEYLTVLLFTLLSSIPSMLLDLPFELYGEFSIEKRFGFSNMTVKQWILDSIKSALVSAVISVPLLLAAVFLLRHVPSLWWLLLGAIYLAFSLGVSFLYPLVVAPLFNKFSPLPNGDLKKRLESLLEKSGFKAEGIYVMDASRRSSHSNAYFTGFGKSKRVVLYDTLINQLSIDEMESVLAHELGHYLGLLHTYTEREGEQVDSCGDTDHCADTPSYNRNEYESYLSDYLKKHSGERLTMNDLVKRLSCDGKAFESTNMMDYSIGYAYAFSDEQKKRVRDVLYYSPLIPGPKKNRTENTRSSATATRVSLPIRTIK